MSVQAVLEVIRSAVTFDAGGAPMVKAANSSTAHKNAHGALELSAETSALDPGQDNRLIIESWPDDGR